MSRVAATDFKARCLQLMDRVAERRETFVITKRGKPVAKLVPVERSPKASLFGWLRGQARECGDIVGPAVAANEWEVLKEWDELNAAAGKRRRRRNVGRKNR